MLWVLGIARTALAPLASLWRWLAADPTRLALAVLLALCAVLAWRLASVDGDRDKWRDRARAYEAASKAVKDTNVKAGAAGVAVAADKKGTIDASNQRAADDAAKSDDPLAAAAERLRSEGAGRGGKATR